MARRTEAALYAAGPATFLALFFALPVAALLARATGGGDALGDGFARLATTPYYRNRIAFTLAQAAASTLLTLAAGLPLAYLFSHHRFPGRNLLRALFTAPFVLPAIVVALALHAAVGPRGVTGVDLLTPIGPVGALLLAHVFYNVSLVLRLVGNYWERIPPGYAEAARTLGATRGRAAWAVELRLVRPAAVAAALLVFVFTLATFGAVLVLGDGRIGTIETLIYEDLRGFRPRTETAAALALLQLAVTYAALATFVLLQRRLHAPVTPRTHAERTPLPPWGAAAVGAATLLLVGPPVALVAASLRPAGAWSARGYELLLSGAAPLGGFTAAQAVRNSLTYAAATLALALALALLAALAAQRARQSAWAEALLLLPLGASSVVVGLGFLLTWNGDPLPDLRASTSRIVLAHTLIAFPFAARILSPTLDGVRPGLREAARTLGARPLALARRVDLPLAYPALGVAAVYAFGASLGEFGAVLLLRRPETTTVPLAIYDGYARLGTAAHAQANALAALLLLVAVAAFLLLGRLRVRAWGEFA